MIDDMRSQFESKQRTVKTKFADTLELIRADESSFQVLTYVLDMSYTLSHTWLTIWKTVYAQHYTKNMVSYHWLPMHRTHKQPLAR